MAALDAKTKAWIDGATYEELLAKWRFAPIGSPLFEGESGQYFSRRLFELREQVGTAEHVRISKKLGW